MTLKQKFFAAFICGTALAMLAVALVGYFFTKDQTKSAVRAEMSALLEMQITRTDGWLRSKTRILEVTATLLRNTVANESISASHLQSFRLDPDVSNLYIGLADGRFFDGADSAAPPGFDPRLQSWYLEAQDKVGIVVTKPYLDKLTNRQAVSFILPLRSPFGKLRGVLGAEVQLAALSNLTRDITLNGAGYAFIIDKDGIFIAHPDPAKLGTLLQNDSSFPGVSDSLLQQNEGSKFFENSNGIQHLQFRKLSSTGWIMAITVPEAEMYRELARMKLQFTVTTLLVMLLVSSLAMFLYHQFVSPLVALGQKALQVAEGDLQSLAALPENERKDEVGQLTASFNEMLTNVALREQERIRQLEQGTLELQQANTQLQTTNNELHEALEQLQQTQGQLIESEKMAALGNLVAGIAHEINTPIGVGVTAASHLEQATNEFFAKYQSDNISRQELSDYLSDNRDAAKILLSNLDRAARLVRNLKQVSLDQASETIRTFGLKEYLEEILLSLHPKLKKTRHRISLDCPPDLTLTTFAGAFSQVIINLIVNSLTHAFSVDEAGRIELRISADDATVSFIYADNGRGMDDATLKRIYEPFFTTKRNSGGSGLGLYLLYNIITQQLKGTVSCSSAPGKGTSFMITLPRELQTETPAE